MIDGAFTVTFASESNQNGLPTALALTRASKGTLGLLSEGLSGHVACRCGNSPVPDSIEGAFHEAEQPTWLCS